MDVLVRPCPIIPPIAGPDFNAVHVWVLDPAHPLIPQHELEDCLTPDERDRAQRYRLDRTRDQFIACRGTLRRLLGGYTGFAPRSVPITYHQAGKPVLVDPVVEFNLSHTDGLALIAVGRQRLGIDVERVRDVPDADALVERFFSPAEREGYRAVREEDRVSAFLRGWTCKEALTKAVGTGVLALDGFDVEMDLERPPAVHAVRHPAFDGKSWSLATWNPGLMFAAAIAVEAVGPIRLTL